MLASGKDMPLKKPATYPGKGAGVKRANGTEQHKPQLVYQARNANPSTRCLLEPTVCLHMLSKLKLIRTAKDLQRLCRIQDMLKAQEPT